jgi:hypothetical protein
MMRKLEILLRITQYPQIGTKLNERNRILLLYVINQTILPNLKLHGHTNFMKYIKDSKISLSLYYETIAPYLKIDPIRLSNNFDWKTFALFNFIILHQYVEKTTQKIYQVEHDEKELQINFNNIQDKILPFNIINFNDKRRSLKSVISSIIDYKYSAQFSHFLSEHGAPMVGYRILQETLVQPYDDQSIIKVFLCLSCYLSNDHFRCYQLLQQLLEKSKDKSSTLLNLLGSLLCVKQLDKPEVRYIPRHYSLGSINVC